jgi:protein TonB
MNADQGQMRSERLGSTLFLAALAHGILILGITFGPFSLPREDAMPSLKVTLLVDSDDPAAATDTAEWLAQRSANRAGQAGEGLRPTTALASSQPLTQLGDPSGAELDDGTPRDPAPSADQLVTRSRRADSLAAAFESADTPAAAASRAAALLNNPVAETQAAEIDLTAQLPRSEVQDDSAFASPEARESMLASYLDSWRRRVERVGTANFPQLPQSAPQTGRPTLEVAIGADGQLEDIIVRHSSGDGALDQAALRILRMAAPFEPLPPAIRAEYDVLRFAYEWDFGAAEDRPQAAPVTTVEAASR